MVEVYILLRLPLLRHIIIIKSKNIKNFEHELIVCWYPIVTEVNSHEEAAAGGIFADLY